MDPRLKNKKFMSGKDSRRNWAQPPTKSAGSSVSKGQAYVNMCQDCSDSQVRGFEKAKQSKSL